MLAVPAAAETLREALVKAYNGNPTLTAQRAAQRATDENVPIARAAGLPAVSVDGGYTENVLSASNGNSNSFSSPNRLLNSSGSVSVPLLTFGAVRNSVRAAETRVDAGRFTLRGTESDLFTDVVGAYMDVIRDDAIVGLNRQNVRVLEVNLQATRDRFQVGDLTRTDVAQSDARLALARSQLQSAEARLISSRENYVRLVGTPPGTLEQPPALPALPASPDQAVDVSLENNPALLAAQRARDATAFDIDVARAGRLPRVSAVVGGVYNNYLGSLGSGTGVRVGQDSLSAQGGLQFTIPLFQGGRPAAQVRQAQARRSQAIEQVTEAERGVIASTRSAYAVWRSSQEVIASSEVAVSANKLSLEGVRAENSVGNRTILDILNAEQELLNSQVNLVTARRDAYVAGFALLASMGRAQARDLNLEGADLALYDPVANYDRVHHRINDFESDPEPQAVASGTRETPAQTATVVQPTDPSLNSNVDRGAAIRGAPNPGAANRAVDRSGANPAGDAAPRR
ncbi:hypothetical protein DVW87_01710 [Sphingomonas aracearum]|uniref:Type I secretion protein TolC n=1 Tax=Sphingomonas aracearum TaxID=2283317 RepID=A0A369W2C2_9SPHN|nr:hypothetical protein DVW87_01710 [Sphingomonas aracearum]